MAHSPRNPRNPHSPRNPRNPRNAADEQSVKDSATRERHEREQQLADMRRLMAEPWGRRVVWRWLNEAGVFATSMTGNSWTFFNEGRRDFGLRLMADIHEACPQRYAEMVAEARAAEQREQAGGDSPRTAE